MTEPGAHSVSRLTQAGRQAAAGSLVGGSLRPHFTHLSEDEMAHPPPILASGSCLRPCSGPLPDPSCHSNVPCSTRPSVGTHLTFSGQTSTCLLTACPPHPVVG